MSKKTKEEREYPRLYRLTKIFDKGTGKSMWEPRMYGQESVAHLPTDQALAKLKEGHDKYMEWIQTLEFGEAFSAVWRGVKDLQKENPAIGFPVYFSSVKMDAGWFRTSPVTEFDINYDGTRIVLGTENSVYLLEEEKD